MNQDPELKNNDGQHQASHSLSSLTDNPSATSPNISDGKFGGSTVNTQLVSEVSRTVQSDMKFLGGWRLYLAALGVSLSLFLVNVEVTILSTSVLQIANDLHSFKQTGWILTAYLITYTGFISILAKLSDMVGRKTCLIGTVVVFTIFSGACGAAQTVTQLIIFRALQGIGAAGGYSLSFLIVYEMAPRAKLPVYAALMGLVSSLATLVGPLFCGAITEHGSWRWVFLLSVPAGVFTIIILMLSMPAGFPYFEDPSRMFGSPDGKAASKFIFDFARLDILGAGLLLGATLLLSTGLLEGGVQFAWSSAASISILAVAGVLWILFFCWEKIVTSDKWQQEPVFPWRFITNRVVLSFLFSSLFNGAALYIVTINLPQRFQTVNGLSPFQSAIRLLPFNFVAAIGAIISNVPASKSGLPLIYNMLLYAALTVIGTGLLTTLPTSTDLPRITYFYIVLSGFGIGGNFSLTALITPHVNEERDLATATGALMEC